MAWWKGVSWGGVIWLTLPAALNAVLVAPAAMKNRTGEYMPPLLWFDWIAPVLWTVFVIGAGFVVGYLSAQRVAELRREEDETRRALDRLRGGP